MAITRAVAEAESKTSGEVVVHLLHGLLPLESSRGRADWTFRRLGLDRTAKRNGVLLFVVMRKRCFEILADAGLDGKIEGAIWTELARRMADTIAREGFERGICDGVARIGEILAQHLPRDPKDVDELPNRPSMED